MATWEVRPGGRSFLYESKRDGRRVRKVYHGRGPGSLAVWLDRQAVRQKAAERQTAISVLLRFIADLLRTARRVRDAALLAAGYRPHRRSWRGQPDRPVDPQAVADLTLLVAAADQAVARLASLAAPSRTSQRASARRRLVAGIRDRLARLVASPTPPAEPAGTTVGDCE